MISTEQANFFADEKKADVHISRLPKYKLRLRVSSEKLNALKEILSQLAVDYGFNLSLEPEDPALPQIREFRADPELIGVSNRDDFFCFTEELTTIIQKSNLSVRGYFDMSDTKLDIRLAELQSIHF